ncbi:exodeoxyribonuclease V subunit beta [Mucilaginibacter gossypii]|uniref:RecBCD enzyme subunit RecB n=1 Tax=Mucilaginibacter gossypii TaxID=551996 RepID=A0A1G8B6C3_9SPHI|nr:exodeoxyribonuclease V subunit beta [Mucilaginibacter gossypii]SDH28769.1 DNA helicase/exodeoxyribonuclease V, beta subunit [Mucilaginibacter gossypii]
MAEKFDVKNVPLTGSNLIEASAGTGKTYSIALLMLRLLLQKRLEVKQILMVTYTKAAVAELEERIRLFVRLAYQAAKGEQIPDPLIASIVQEAIGQADEAAIRELLRSATLLLDETAVMTIHSFCQQSLNEFAFETGQLFDCELLEDPSLLVEEEVNKFWREKITTLTAVLLRELLLQGFSRKWLADAIKGYMAGQRYVNYVQGRHYSLSADDKAALEISLAEAHAAAIQAETALFESVTTDTAMHARTQADATARRNLSILIGDPPAFIAAIKEKRQKGSAYINRLYEELLEQCDDVDALKERSQQIIWDLIDRLICMAIEVAVEEIDSYKSQHSILLFDDLINKLHRAAMTDKNGALKALMQSKFKAVFIDEFQDTDKLQYELFEYFFGDETILFYIGDPKQSIYSFRKADIFTYLQAAENVSAKYEMNTNFRSSPTLIAAMNNFFEPVQDFDTFSFGTGENGIKYVAVEAPDGLENMGLYRNDELQVPMSVYQAPNKPAAANMTAQAIHQLLNDPTAVLVKKDKKQQVTPAAIGVLVRNRYEGADVKAALGRLGIPAVTIDDARILNTLEAVSMLALLTAFETPSRSAINKALLTPIAGLGRDALLKLNEEQTLEQFQQYGELWANAGIYVALTGFFAEHQVRKRLLSQKHEGGERVLTNLVQLTELLHKVQTGKQLANIELINWLQKAVDGMDVGGDEYQQRIESDEESVKIVTIHKSKGLEYPIVFAPYLDFKFKDDFVFCSFRDHDSAEYLFIHQSQLSSDQLAAYRAQQEQENKRLLYVAITRAVYQCYLVKNTDWRYNNSSLNDFFKALKDAPPPSDLIIFADGTGPAADSTRNFSAPWQAVPPRTAKQFVLAEPNWHKLSYTFLTAKHEYIPREDITTPEAAYDVFIFKQLPKGAITGNFLHYLFENIDFGDLKGWQQVIDAGLNRFFPGSTVVIAQMLLQLLDHVIGSKIMVNDQTIALSSINRNARISEFEFDFPVSVFNNRQLGILGSGEDRDYSGIMNGKIDLFFELNGKYYLLDWKSNFLGFSTEAYAGDELKQAMDEYHYHLQYLLYAVALKKYLSVRLADFSYEKHFGGVIYMFLRGVRNGAETGVFTYRPALAEIVGLEDLFMTPETA